MARVMGYTATNYGMTNDYISKGPGSKGPGSKRPAQRVPKKRVPQQLWHIFSPSRTIFKASRMGHFECTQVQNVHNSIYSYGGMGPYEMYTNMAAQDWGGGHPFHHQVLSLQLKKNGFEKFGSKKIWVK